LSEASKIPKKKTKKMVAAANFKQHKEEKKVQSNSSSAIVVPARHSSFYNDYRAKLESNRHILEEQLTSENYKEKFHHLLCWEEQEHDKQLAER